jgi:hypothetical protein
MPGEGVPLVVTFGQDLAGIGLDRDMPRGEGGAPTQLPDREVAGELAVQVDVDIGIGQDTLLSLEAPQETPLRRCAVREVYPFHRSRPPCAAMVRSLRSLLTDIVMPLLSGRYGNGPDRPSCVRRLREPGRAS